MSDGNPLTGVVLVDCARANAESGVAIAAQQCGYGEDTESFQSALSAACSEMGIEVGQLSELLEFEDKQQIPKRGIEVAPDTTGEL